MLILAHQFIMPNLIDWKVTMESTLHYTVVSQWFQYSGITSNNQTLGIKHLSPLGMVKTISHVLSLSRCKASFAVLPSEVKKFFNLCEQTYEPKKMKLSVTDEGDKGVETFKHIVCNLCLAQLENIRKSIKLKIPERDTHEPHVVQMINNWNVLKLKISDRYLVGCLCSSVENVSSGPNRRRYIERPADHWNCYHAADQKKLPSQAQQELDAQKITSSRKSATIIQHLTKIRPPSRTISNKININEKCFDELDEFAKGHMCQIVMTGVDKMVSQNAILAFYESSCSSIDKLYEITLKGLEAGGKKVLPPRVALNRNNIISVEHDVLTAYKNSSSEDNPYQKLRKAEFFSATFDGGSEYVTTNNATFSRSVANDGLWII